MTAEISFHLIEDCETISTLSVVLNNETATPIGHVKIYDMNCSSFLPFGDEPIDLSVLYQISKIFGFIEYG